MLKKTLLLCFLLLLPLGAQAKCDLSVEHTRIVAQKKLDLIYARAPLPVGKPRLIISNKKVDGYFAEELKGVITLYPKTFVDDCYCDNTYDGFTPFVGEVISHEYTHFLDEKIGLSKKIGEKKMSENTAYIGERLFDDIIWQTGYYTKDLTASDMKKYDRFMRAIKASR